MRIILYTGKGGAGKTTLAAATALYSAHLGHRTLAVSTDTAHSLADALQLPLGNDPRAVGASGLDAAELDSASELEHYWGEIKQRITALLVAEGVDATAAGELAVLPGLDEIIALVRIKRIYNAGCYDGLIIDSAPTGAAMRLLAAPDLTNWYTRYLTGLTHSAVKLLLPKLQGAFKLPISAGAIQERLQELIDELQALRALLTDNTVTTVRLVLNPDNLSLRETQRAYTYFSLFGLTVDALYLNRLYPSEIADPYLQNWIADQAHYRQEAAELFAPLPLFEVPLQRREVLGSAQLLALAEALYGDIDPLPPLAEEQPVSYSLEQGRYTLMLRVSGITSGEVELNRQGDELQVRLSNYRRTLTLPQYLAGLQPTFAEVNGEHLRVIFETAGVRR
ncbi:MAG: ArsA family ATPase [Chloroflexi bacterium]|nr:ArsA family ATPase [Chloroflexota bacterium]